jgi:hypothetical protein
MSRCPYTWVRSFFAKPPDPNATEARYLRVRVVRDAEERVSVSLPANSAHRLIDLIPDDVVAKIREEMIPIDEIQTDLRGQERMIPGPIFHLTEPHRHVEVWLE